jgi:opacity protein-like surface antigen
MKTTSKFLTAATTFVALAAAAPAAFAEATQAPATSDVASNVAAAPTPPPPPPPPYSLPWQLRPVTVGNVVRLDTTLAFYENPNLTADASGETVASMLLASYKITPDLAPLIRLGIVQNSEPGPALNRATAFVNPIVGLTYSKKLSGPFRLGTFLGATLPIGMGGGKRPAVSDTATAVRRGIQARSGMDNAMYAVNYMTGIVGLGGAYIANKLTIQAEATLLQLFRVRNETLDGKPFEVDSKRTNLTAGLHVGYFLAPFVSLGAEYRFQRWLSTPDAVDKNPDLRDTQTVAFGPRFHFKLGNTWLRPGISYATAVDKPLKDASYHMVQVDVPAVF